MKNLFFTYNQSLKPNRLVFFAKGQEIPKPTPPEIENAEVEPYIIQKNDSLSQIAEKQGLPSYAWRLLKDFHEIKSKGKTDATTIGKNNWIEAGKTLYLPKNKDLLKKYAKESGRVVEKTEEEQKQYKQLITEEISKTEKIDYKVKKGDNIWKIAKRNNISVDELIGYHNTLAKDETPQLSKTKHIKIDQIIYLPKDKIWATRAKVETQKNPEIKKALEELEKASKTAATKTAEKTGETLGTFEKTGKAPETKVTNEEIKKHIDNISNNWETGIDSVVEARGLLDEINKTWQMIIMDKDNISDKNTSALSKIPILGPLSYKQDKKGDIFALVGNGKYREDREKELAKENQIVYPTDYHYMDDLVTRELPDTGGDEYDLSGKALNTLKDSAILTAGTLTASVIIGTITAQPELTLVFAIALGRFDIGLGKNKVETTNEKDLQTVSQFLFYSNKILSLKEELKKAPADKKEALQKELDEYMTKLQLLLNAIEKKRNESLKSAINKKYDYSKNKDITIKEGKDKIEDSDKEIARYLDSKDAEKYAELMNKYEKSKKEEDKTNIEVFIKGKYEEALIKANKETLTSSMKDEIIRQKNLRAELKVAIKDYSNGKTPEKEEKIKNLQEELQKFAYQDQELIKTKTERAKDLATQIGEEAEHVGIDIAKKVGITGADGIITKEEKETMDPIVKEKTQIDQTFQEGIDKLERSVDEQRSIQQHNTNVYNALLQPHRFFRWFTKDKEATIDNATEKSKESQTQLNGLYDEKLKITDKIAHGDIIGAKQDGDFGYDFIPKIMGTDIDKVSLTPIRIQGILKNLLGRYYETQAALINDGIDNTLGDLNKTLGTKKWYKESKTIKTLKEDRTLKVNESPELKKLKKNVAKIYDNELLPIFNELGITNLEENNLGVKLNQGETIESKINDPKTKKSLIKALKNLYEAVKELETYDVDQKIKKEEENKIGFDAIIGELTESKENTEASESLVKNLEKMKKRIELIASMSEGTLDKNIMEDFGNMSLYLNLSEGLNNEIKENVDLKNLIQDPTVDPSVISSFEKMQKLCTNLYTLSENGINEIFESGLNSKYDKEKMKTTYLSKIKEIYQQIAKEHTNLLTELAKNQEIVEKNKNAKLKEKVLGETLNLTNTKKEQSKEILGITEELKTKHKSVAELKTKLNEIKKPENEEKLNDNEKTKIIVSKFYTDCPNLKIPVKPENFDSPEVAAKFLEISYQLNDILDKKQGLEAWTEFHEMLKKQYNIDLKPHGSLATTSPYEMLTDSNLQGFPPQCINMLLLELPERQDKKEGTEKPAIGTTMARTLAALDIYVSQSEIMDSIAKAKYIPASKLKEYGLTTNTGAPYYIPNVGPNAMFALDGGYEIKFTRRVMAPDPANPTDTSKYTRRKVEFNLLLRQKCFNLNIPQYKLFSTQTYTPNITINRPPPPSPQEELAIPGVGVDTQLIAVPGWFKLGGGGPPPHIITPDKPNAPLPY